VKRLVESSKEILNERAYRGREDSRPLLRLLVSSLSSKTQKKTRRKEKLTIAEDGIEECGALYGGIIYGVAVSIRCSPHAQ
jgi:hypothetical protein